MMKRGCIFLLMIVLGLVFSAQSAMAAFVCEQAYYRDASRKLDVEGVQQVDESAWRSIDPTKLTNLGFTRAVVWVRISVRSENDAFSAGFIQLNSTRIQHVDWFVTRQGMVLKHELSGNKCPVDKAHFCGLRQPNLQFDLPPGEEREIYLRLESETALQIGVWVAGAGEFVQSMVLEESLRTFLIGGMIGLLLLLYLFVWATGRRAAGFYAVGITLMGLIYPVMGGFHVFLKLPGSDFLSHHGILLMSNIGMTLLLFHGAISLELHKTRAMKGVLFYAGLIVLVTVIGILLPFRLSVFIAMPVVILNSVLMAVFALNGMVKGQRIARFYFAGNIFLWVYMCSQMLFYYGWITYPIHPENAGVIGITISIALYLVSEARWIKVMRAEKENAQERAMELQQQLNSELGTLVAERTKELEKANQAQTEFFSKVSHDLRSPINWLIGLTESMLLECRDLSLSKDFMRYLEHVKKGSYYLIQLLDNIMSAGFLENGEQGVNLGKVELKEWSDGLEATAQVLAKVSNTALDWSSDTGKRARIGMDSARTAQILMNLVHNSLKFSPEGSCVQVKIGVQASDLVFTVQDEGEGLSPQQMEQIRTFQNSESRSIFQQRGLGLQIVNRNLSLLGGKISVKNMKPKGAFFRVSVPITCGGQP